MTKVDTALKLVENVDSFEVYICGDIDFSFLTLLCLLGL